MKKIALVFCFSAFLLSGLFAQEMSGFRFGLQASPSWSWLRTTDKKIEGVSSNWGMKLGVLGEYYFANNYALTTGLGFGFNHGGFIQNGYTQGTYWAKSDLTAESIRTVPLNTKLHYRVTYVEIPLGFKMRGGTREDSDLKFYAEAPIFTLGFVTKATGDVRGSNLSADDENIRSDVNGLSLCWGLGAGIEYKLGSVSAVGGIAYQKQFTDLTRDAGSVEVSAGNLEKEDSKATFGLISLKLGIFF